MYSICGKYMFECLVMWLSPRVAFPPKKVLFTRNIAQFSEEDNTRKHFAKTLFLLLHTMEWAQFHPQECVVSLVG